MKQLKDCVDTCNPRVSFQHCMQLNRYYGIRAVDINSSVFVNLSYLQSIIYSIHFAQDNTLTPLPVPLQRYTATRARKTGTHHCNQIEYAVLLCTSRWLLSGSPRFCMTLYSSLIVAASP